MFLQQCLINIFKGLDILHETDDILDVSECIEDRGSRYDPHSCAAVHIVKAAIHLKSGDTLLFLHDQIKNADIHDL